MGTRQRAIVIGGSMSGILAARVLADHFSEVLLFDRDTFPAEVDNRKGVPQGRHAHALLSSGRATLESFFPGFRDELIARGAKKGDYNTARWFDNGVYHTRFTGIEILQVSRPLLETHARQRLAALPGVRINSRHDIDSIAFDGSRVTGVRVRSADGIEQSLTADLIVDASGRGSQSPAWLEQNGFPRPQESVVRVGLGYVSRVYRRLTSHLNGDTAVICPSAPPARRGGVALLMEGDRWIVTQFGMLGDHPPTDDAGYLEFAKTLPGQDIHDLISHAEPLSECVAFKFPQSTRRHYEKLDRFPDGYLVFGDAICSFNPIYGQGMSSAALQAAALQQCMTAGDQGLAKRFFKAASQVVEGPWTMAVGGDLRYADVEGPRNAMVKFINWYIGKLHIAAAGDAEVARSFHRVANLLDPPPAILKPNVALRVLQGNLRKAN